MPTADQIGSCAGFGIVNPSDYGFSSVQDMANFCSSWKNWLTHDPCWPYSPDAWSQMSQFNIPLPPPHVPAVQAGTSTTPAPYTDTEYQAALDAAIAEAKAQADAQNLAFFQSQPVVDGSAPTSSGIPTWLLIAGAAVIGVLVLRR